MNARLSAHPQTRARRVWTCFRPQLIATLLALGACGQPASTDYKNDFEPGDATFKRDAALNVENNSEAGATKSHNAGENCFKCHQSNGPGKGLFSVAGTLYGLDGEVSPNGTLQLLASDKPGAQVVIEVQADAYGNFYSTRPLPFPNQPLFTRVVDAQGKNENRMPFPTISGACNVCHNPANRVRLKAPGTF